MRARRSWATALLFLAAALLAVLGAGAALAADPQPDILSQTAGLRGLQPRAEVPYAFVDGEQLERDLLKSYNDQQTVQDLEISRKLLVMLGLLSPDADLHGMLVELYSENILGYYSSQDKKMYLVSEATDFGPQEKVTLAHEFTHALQDQYFGLERVQAGTEDNGDKSLAVTALVEGDATLSMIRYAREFLTPDEVFQLQTSSPPSSIDRAPLVVRDEVTFPYNEGAIFAITLWQQGGNAALDRAFADLPTSTEQIMHPDKYLAHEQPLEVSLPNLAAALGPGWQQLRTDVLGELDIRILLEQFSEPGAAARGAEGWGGDRFVLLENGAGEDALVISTVWDNQQEAAEFYGLYVDTVARRYGARARRVLESPTKLAWLTPNGALLIQLTNDRVTIVIAPNEGIVNTLVTSLGESVPRPQPGPSPSPSPRPAPAQVPN